VPQVIAEIDALIDDGVAKGKIGQDTGLDLDNLVRNLEARLNTGESVDLRSPVADLRTKVKDRVREGSIDPAYGSALVASLDRLAAAA